jgi:hypothetical protein
MRLPEFQVVIPIVSYHRRGLEATAELGFPEELELDENVSLHTKTDESGRTNTEAVVQLKSENRDCARLEALSLTKDFLNVLSLRSGMGSLPVFSGTKVSEKTQATLEKKAPGVYEATVSDTILVSGSLHMKYLKDPKVLIEWYSDSKAIHEKDDHFDMLLELYAMSWHEAFPRSRYLTLITILEGLAPERESIDDLSWVFEQISQYVKEMESSWLSNSDNEFRRRFYQLKSRLGDAQKESISDTLRTLVSDIETEDENLGSTVSELYGLRSDLIHGRVLPENVDLDAKTNALRTIVEKLLSMRLDTLLQES